MEGCTHAEFTRASEAMCCLVMAHSIYVHDNTTNEERRRRVRAREGKRIRQIEDPLVT